MRISSIIGGPLSDGEAIDIACKAEATLVPGDVVKFTTTNSSTYPLGIGVNKAGADTERVAGVVVAPASAAAGDTVIVRTYGFCANITTDGNVASTDLFLRTGATGIAVGNTASEVNADITTANIAGLASIFAINCLDDAGTVGSGFIKKMGIL
jgi:hypothetical protein